MQEIFNRYINYLAVERNASPYTVRNYTNDLLGNYSRGTGKGFFQFLRLKKINSLNEVDKHVLRDYLSYLMEQGLAKASIARKLSAIRSFYRYLLREEIITSSPVTATSSPKLDRRLPSFLTIDEITRLLEAPDLTAPQGQRDRAFLELLYAAGLRVSELVRLNLEQVTLGTHEIRGWGKGAKERMGLMGEPAARALIAYLDQGRLKLLGKKRSNALFVNRYGGRLPERRIQIILGKYARLAGIGRRVHPHLLRHTFATHMYEAGVSIDDLKEIMGHDDNTETTIYIHITLDAARRMLQEHIANHHG